MDLLTGLSCFNSKYGKEYSIDLVLKKSLKKIFIFTKNEEKIKNRIYWWYHLHGIEFNDSIWENICIFNLSNIKNYIDIHVEIGNLMAGSVRCGDYFGYLPVFISTYNNTIMNNGRYGAYNFNIYNKETYVKTNVPDLIYIDNDYYDEHDAPYMLDFQNFIYPKKCPIIFHSDVHTHNDCKVATNFINVLISNNIMTINITKLDNVEVNNKLLYKYIKYDNGHRIIENIIDY